MRASGAAGAYIGHFGCKTAYFIAVGDIFIKCRFEVTSVACIIISLGVLLELVWEVQFSRQCGRLYKSGRQIDLIKHGKLVFLKGNLATDSDNTTIREIMQATGPSVVTHDNVPGYLQYAAESAQKARAPIAPFEQPAAERAAHELVHVPFAAWCPDCVSGKARERLAVSECFRGGRLFRVIRSPP